MMNDLLAALILDMFNEGRAMRDLPTAEIRSRYLDNGKSETLPITLVTFAVTTIREREERDFAGRN